jgi:hypothetical protein
LFLASPSALPLQRGVRKTNKNELDRIDVLLVLEAGSKAEMAYQLDDGATEGWREGTLSRFALEAHLEGDQVAVTLTNPLRAFGGMNLRFLVLSPTKLTSLTFNGKPFGLTPETLPLAGSTLKLSASVEIDA